MTGGAGLPRSHLAWGALAAAFILAFNVAYVSSYVGFVHKPRKVLETDHYRYIEMAEGPDNPDPLARTAPFCWRVLAPFVAYLMTKGGLTLNQAFYIATNTFLFGFLFVFFLYLRMLGHRLGVALLGLALVGLLQGAVRWYEYQYWMTDPPCLFFLVLAFYLAEGRRERWLRLTAPLGVLARESYLLVFPYYLLHEAKRGGWRQGLVRTATLAAIPLAVLCLLRLVIVPTNPHSALDTARNALAFRSRHLLDNQMYLLTVGAFGVLVPLALLFPKRIWPFCRTRYDEAVFVAMVYASLAVASNTERLLAYALPVVLPAALRSLEGFAARTRIPLALAGSVALGLQGLLYARARFAGEQGVSLYQPADAVVAAAMVLFWGACQALLFRSSRASPSGGGAVSGVVVAS